MPWSLYAVLSARFLELVGQCFVADFLIALGPMVRAGFWGGDKDVIVVTDSGAMCCGASVYASIGRILVCEIHCRIRAAVTRGEVSEFFPSNCCIRIRAHGGVATAALGEVSPSRLGRQVAVLVGELMSLPIDEARKYTGEHVGAFLVAAMVILVPLLGSYAYIVSEYKSLNEARVLLEKERAEAKLEEGRAKLDVEKLQGQLANAIDSSKKFLEDIASRQKQTESDNQRLAEAWKNIDLWRQKLNPDQEFKVLSEEFTALGIDLNHCVPPGENEKYQRARLVAQRLWYAAVKTNVAENLAFAKGIQSQYSPNIGCRSSQKAP